MIIIPAIDLKDGKVVRLTQGDFNQVTVYSDDPVGMARQWVAQGAQCLHVVDLDGAQTGSMANLKSILAIAKSCPVPVQVGGGIRGREDIERLISSGVQRVILGTRVIEDRTFLAKSLERWPAQIALALDCCEGKVVTRGWTQKTEIKAVDLLAELKPLGLLCIIFTDIKRDGMLQGPNFAGVEELLQQITIPLIVSGGVSTIDDVRKLCAIKTRSIVGAIVGKALYEKKIDLKEALQICSQSVSSRV